MKNLFSFNNLFYTALLLVIFFSGMDGSLLYQRTFLDIEIHTLNEYFQFYFAAFGGWFIGYFLIRKMVSKYELNYIFRVSLLVATISIWTQYKTNHHSMERLFSQLIIDNVYCSVLLGLLSYSVVRIMNGKNELEYMKKQKLYSLIALLLGAFYSYTLTDSKLDSGFLLSTLIYFLTYLYFLKNGLDKLDYNVRLNPAIPMGFTCFIILIGIATVYFRFLENLKFYSEESYPVMVFVLFLIFEATQHKKNMLKIVEVKKEEPKIKLEKEPEMEKKKFGIGKKK
jgi:hypothetical protein